MAWLLVNGMAMAWLPANGMAMAWLLAIGGLPMKFNAVHSRARHVGDSPAEAPDKGNSITTKNASKYNTQIIHL